jgi:fibulin 1/2
MLCDHEDYECFRKPTSYSFNFIAMVPNMTVSVEGTALFNLQTTVWTQDLDFDLKIIDIHAPPNVEVVNEHFFR